ncbi:MAG: hypothetical protein ACOC2D_06595 [Spirochaetota bacterium]
MHARNRTRLAAVLIASILLAVVATSAAAIDPANLNRITFVNKTGYDIVYLFFSPGDSDYWGADLLGTTRTLDDGEKVGFYIHHPDATNAFDFLAIDEDGDAYIIWDYEITDGDSAVIEVTLEDLEGGYDLPALATVDLINDTGYDIWFAFFSPGDSRVWGIDMLDDETILEPDETLSLLVPVTDTATRYDFHGVDVDEDAYEFWVELSDAQSEYTYAIEFSDLVD